MPDSRLFATELVALAVRSADGRVHIQAPAPGLHRGAPERGELVRPGMLLGELEQLGVLHRIRAPEQAQGVVVETAATRARQHVERGSVLLVLDPEALVGAAGLTTSTETSTDTGALVYRAPSAGRFFVRPAPDKPAFVEVGQLVTRGQTIGLIEVMKTFTRVHYDDPRLPDRARVTAIAVRDQDEIEAGTVLLQLEPESPS